MDFKRYFQYEATNFVNNVAHKDILDALHHIYLDYANTGKTIVCTYTHVNKVGINPSSRFNTPTGIYFYGLEYLVSVGADPPYAGEMNHLNVCEVVKPITHMHHIRHYNNVEYGSYRMIEKLKELSAVDNRRDEIIESSLYQQKDWMNVKNMINDENVWRISLPSFFASNDYEIRSDYSFVWLATKFLSSGNPAKWSKILKNMGYNGFIDEGTGTIHDHEPYQGLVFDKSSLKVIQTLNNEKMNPKPPKNPTKNNPQSINISRRGLINSTLLPLFPISDIYTRHISFNNKNDVDKWNKMTDDIIESYLDFGSFWIRQHKLYGFPFNGITLRSLRGRVDSFIKSTHKKIVNSGNEYKHLYLILLKYLEKLNSFNEDDYKEFDKEQPVTQFSSLSKIIQNARNYARDVAAGHNHSDDDDTDFNVKYKKQSSKYPEKLR